MVESSTEKQCTEGYSMSIVGSIENSISNLSITDPKAWNPVLWQMGGSQSLTGEVVNEATALTYSAIYCANYILSTTISTLPLQLLRQQGNTTVKATDESLYRVMHSEFNRYMTAQVGREVLASHVLMWGNGYAEKVKNGLGQIVELWPITPDRVTPKMKDGELVYHVKVGNEEKILTRDQILHIPGLGYDGFRGYSVITMARRSIGLSMAMETFGSLYFGNGTHPSAVVTHPNKITNTNLREALTTTYAGLGQSHRLMLLEEGMTIKDIGISSEDSQFLESRTFQVSEVARWFNIPLHKLKELERATNNNIEAEQISFVVDTTLPWLIRFEQNYDQQLLSKNQKEVKDEFFRHNVDGLLRGNSKDRAQYYRIMVTIGAMSPNDVREKEKFDKSNQPFMNSYFFPLNTIPSELLEEYLLASKNNQQSVSDGSTSTPDDNEPQSRFEKHFLGNDVRQLLDKRKLSLIHSNGG